VIAPDGLDHAAVARRALVGHDDAPDRVLPTPDARQPYTYCQVSVHLSRWKRRRRTLAAPRELRQVRHLSLRQRAHHLLHLAELLHELVHRAHVRSGPLSDAAAAGTVEDRRVGPLLLRHRRDDRLNAVELAVVDLQATQLAAEAGDHLQQAAHGPHAANLVQLLEEVVEGELLLADLAFELLRLLLVELALRLLD